jgi:hypothetical protein
MEMARKVIMDWICPALLISSTGKGLAVSFLALWMSIDIISESHRPANRKYKTPVAYPPPSGPANVSHGLLDAVFLLCHHRSSSELRLAKGLSHSNRLVSPSVADGEQRIHEFSGSGNSQLQE